MCPVHHSQDRSLPQSPLLIKSPRNPGRFSSRDEFTSLKNRWFPIMPEKSSAADAPDSPFPPPEPPTVLFHLLGQVPFEQFAALQRRLVYELGEESRSRFPVLICEHPPLITVGRRGSRAHIRLSGEQLRWRQLAVQWVSRGGGCVLHAPGQLAIYPLIPLGRLGWTVGKYLRSLQQGLRNALESLKIPSQVGTDDWGIWGRTGQLAAIGFSVRNEIAHYGAYLNVNPSMSSYHYLETPHPPLSGRTAAEIQHQPGSRLGTHSGTPLGTQLETQSGAGPISPSGTRSGSRSGTRSGMSSLLAERKQGVRMSEVRAALMEHLCTAWGAPNYHILSGHPFLERTHSAIRGTNARAS